jgi:hypothetical protein
LDCAHPEAFQGYAGLHPIWASEFVQTCLDPLPAKPYTDGQPENGEAFVTENQIDNRRGFERLTFAGENMSRHFQVSFLSFIIAEFLSNLLMLLIYTFQVVIISVNYHNNDSFYQV